MFAPTLTTLLAGAAIVSASVTAPIGSHAQQQQPLKPVISASQFKCDLPPVLDPQGDGLPSAAELFSSKDALELQVRRHQAIVRIPTISYDEAGFPDQDDDERWKPFYEIHDVLEKTYPAIYRRAKVEKINTFGLLYTIQGSDSSLQPILLMAHLDVVPVADASTWTYPPFDAVYDGAWIWGRGASDDKNGVTAIMSALEALLSQQETWKPKRTVLVAFGFDEESSGYDGAGHISQHLLGRYGPDSVAIVLDEGGLSFQPVGDVLYAMPAVTEKGHMNIWMELDVAGGHSSRPFPHTGIGIIAEMVTILESHPFEPQIIQDGPVHQRLQCQAVYSPHAQPDLTKAIKQNDLRAAAELLVNMGRESQYTIQTSQAVDVISGGQKLNAMPEKITLGVNYRVSHQNSLAEVQHSVVNSISSVIEKYDLTVRAFEGDADYERYVSSLPASSLPGIQERFTVPDVDYNGTLILTALGASHPSPISPSSGPVWDIFAGTIRHTFQTENQTVVPSADLMTGNTDTRHYRDLSKHIYRFAPYRFAAEDSIHTVDEHVRMEGQMEMVQFFYDFVRNFDAAVTV